MAFPDNWLGYRCSPFGEKYVKRKEKLKNRFEFIDVRMFVFAFTPYADELSLRSYGLMKLPQDFRDDIDLITNGPTRVLYQLWCSKPDERRPIVMEEDFEEAIQWVRSLPHEALGRWDFPKEKLRKRLLAQQMGEEWDFTEEEAEQSLRLLWHLTYRQRDRVLQILEAYRQISKEKDQKYTERAIAKKMGIHRSTLYYHKKSNQLAGELLRSFARQKPRQDPITYKAALEDSLTLKGKKRDPNPQIS